MEDLELELRCVRIIKEKKPNLLDIDNSNLTDEEKTIIKKWLNK